MPKLQTFINEKTATVQYGNQSITLTYSLDGASLQELMAMADVAKVLKGDITDVRTDTALTLVYQYLAAYVRSWDLEENDSTPEAPRYVALTEQRLTETGPGKIPGNLIVTVFNALFDALPTSPSVSPVASQETPPTATSENETA